MGAIYKIGLIAAFIACGSALAAPIVATKSYVDGGLNVKQGKFPNFANNRVMISDGNGNLKAVAGTGASGEVLISQGNALPTWGAAIPAGQLSLPLSVENGGTGAVTFPAGEVLVGNGSSGIQTKRIETTLTPGSGNPISSGAVASALGNFLSTTGTGQTIAAFNAIPGWSAGSTGACNSNATNGSSYGGTRKASGTFLMFFGPGNLVYMSVSAIFKGNDGGYLMIGSGARAHPSVARGNVFAYELCSSGWATWRINGSGFLRETESFSATTVFQGYVFDMI